ncbi:YdbH domain-containing protein [Photobacterium japonica]|uniref:intermembrane phospholipid transport protein YdbH family protein n=1 Tax=Photobacterium japonica TaxID=2910235 RepID=UPI003D109923
MGIQLHALSGVSLGKQSHIQYLSLSIHDYTVTLHDLSLTHAIDDNAAISGAAWQLHAPQVEIQLPLSLNQTLDPVNVTSVTLADASITLVNLNAPYVFNGHAQQIVLGLSGPNETKQNEAEQSEPHYDQILKDVDLVLTTDPFVTLTGTIKGGQLDLFFPQDTAHNRYPIAVQAGQFSLSWQAHDTPLAVHLTRIEPQWPTVIRDFAQYGEDITLRMNIEQPIATMKITAKSLVLDQPVHLPTFIETPDTRHQGIHLGQTIAHLAQLPLRKVKVAHFTYGHLLLQSKVVIETPHFRMNKPDRKARLHIKGRALWPNPYRINVLVKHRDAEQAHIAGSATGPKGNTVHCEAEVSFTSPLPKQLSCNADIKQTKDITDKFQLAAMPNVILNAPVTLTATQTAITQDTVIKEAQYTLQFSLPAHMQLHLPTAIVPDALFRRSLSGNNQNQANVQSRSNTPSRFAIKTDRTLAFTVHYQQDHVQPQQGRLTIDLNPVPEALTVSTLLAQPSTQSSHDPHTQTGDQADNLLGINITALHCNMPINHTLDDKPPQCHLKSTIHGQLRALYPSPTTSLDNITLDTMLKGYWTPQGLHAEWHNTRLQIAQANIKQGGRWVEAKADNIQIDAKHWHLSVLTEAKPKQAKVSVTLPHQPLTLKAKLSAKQIISDGDDSDKQIKAIRRTTTKAQLPVQHYTGQLAMTLSELQFSLLTSDNTSLTSPSSTATNKTAKKRLTPFTLRSAYHLKLTPSQNKQRLPTLQTEGQTTLNHRHVDLDGTLYSHRYTGLRRADSRKTDSHRTDLLSFSARYNWQRNNADITLHRNDIHFSSKQSLKKFYLPHLPVNYDLHAGKISFDARIQYRPSAKPNWQARFGVFTHNLSGYVDNIHFADLNLAMTSEVTPQGLRSLQPIGLNVGYLHAGILLENLYANLSFDTSRSAYRLYRANAYMLGGSVSLHDVSSDSVMNIPPAPVIVQGIHLDQLVASLEANDIVMTGVVDGRLPLSFQDGSPVIEHGSLHARYPGGILKYKEESAIAKNIEAAGEQNLLVVGKILKNYNYHTLSVHLDYSKEGELRTKAAFKGHNPDVLAGRQVNVNLSLQENIPALIKTMNMIDSSKLEALFLKQMGVDE